MENLTVGLTTTLIGITIVFSVLIALSVILDLLKYVGVSEKPVADSVPVPSSPPSYSPVVVPSAPELVTTAQNDECELVAVITAAIAASLNTPADRLVVRSFRKVSGWNEVSRREQQD